MLRIPHFLVALLALFPLASACAQTTSVKAGPKPNIVLVLADDLSWHDIGVWDAVSTKLGNIPTPNIDRIANEGLRFDQAYTATAICSPARQQLYTGLYPARSGAAPNHSRINDGIVTLPARLNRAGYRSAISGKQHYGPVPAFPFQDLGGSLPDGKDYATVDFAKIEQFLRADDSKPFFLVVASSSPHGPFTRQVTPVAASNVKVPPYLPAVDATRNGLANYYQEVGALDAEIGRLDKLLADTGKRDNTLFIFVTEQGSSFPFSKWTLYNAGTHNGVLMRWPGRIGSGVTSSLVQTVDVAATILDVAGVPDPALDGRSLRPLLADPKAPFRDLVYGIHTNLGAQKANAYPIRSIRSDRYKLIWNLNHEARYSNVTTGPGSMVGRWLADPDPAVKARAQAYLQRPMFEFYDVTQDPYELKNLAGDPALKPAFDRLKTALDQWMAQQGDKGMALEMAACKHLARRRAVMRCEQSLAAAR